MLHRLRFPSALLALLALAAAGAETAWGLHVCPHHDALPAAHADAAPDHAAHDGGAHPGAHAADAAADPEDAEGSHQACTCLGHCQVGSAPAPGARVSVSVRLPDAPERSASAPRAEAPALSPIPYRLHRPNAPPLPA